MCIFWITGYFFVPSTRLGDCARNSSRRRHMMRGWTCAKFGQVEAWDRWWLLIRPTLLAPEDGEWPCVKEPGGPGSLCSHRALQSNASEESASKSRHWPWLDTQGGLLKNAPISSLDQWSSFFERDRDLLKVPCLIRVRGLRGYPEAENPDSERRGGREFSPSDAGGPVRRFWGKKREQRWHGIKHVYQGCLFLGDHG